MIGIFDSGIGGLTVVRELLRQVPDASFVYLGDTARTPYGNKSRETIIRYALEDAAFLVTHGATSLVIACNTLSAVAVSALREAYPQLVILDVITPAVEDALSVTRGAVGVIGTRATIGSGIYQVLLNDVVAKISEVSDKAQDVSVVTRRVSHNVRVLTQACPLFVPLVEEGWTKQVETMRIVRRYLSPLRRAQIDTLILGCTHYPMLKTQIAHAVGTRVCLVDSAESVVTRLISAGGVGTNGVQRYFFTDTSAHSVLIAQRWLHRKILPELAMLPVSL